MCHMNERPKKKEKLSLPIRVIPDREKLLERIENFRLLDNDFMMKCFEDNIPATELALRIILGKNDLHVKNVKTEYWIKNLQGRSAALDIYAIDDTGKRYDIEIQRSNAGAGARRARHNSSLMDANILQPGQDPKELPDTYVIFITEKDVIGKGLPLYSIERTISPDDIYFNDGSHIIYVNGACIDDTPLGKLMHDFSCKKANDMNYKILADRVRYFKEDEEGIRYMCESMEELVNEVQKASFVEAAMNLLKLGKNSLEEIARCTKLSLEEVELLAQDLESPAM